MKRLYFLVVLGMICFSSNAQNFVYSNEQHVVEVIPGPFNPFYINFSTPNPEEITFKFERISNTLPEEWDYSLCDYTNCYVGVPATGTMTTITLANAQNGVEGYFNLTVNPFDIAGEGIIELYVFDSKNHERGDTVSWTLSFESTVSTNDFEARESFKVYPNPASDVLNIDIDGFYSGAIFNGLGKKVLSIEGDRKHTVDVSNLANGVYFISCQDESGQVFNKQLIIQ